jgi:hypothetical protein
MKAATSCWLEVKLAMAMQERADKSIKQAGKEEQKQNKQTKEGFLYVIEN